MAVFSHRRKDLWAFLSSATFIAGMLASTAFGLYPNVLPASTGPEYSLTVSKTLTHEYGLGIGIIWWTVGIILALGYLVFLIRSFRGKVSVPAEEEGY